MKSHLFAGIVWGALALLPVHAQTNVPAPATTNQSARLVERGEQVRNACIEGRRTICGRVTQVTKDGLVVESGYTSLTLPPFNRSWVVRASVAVSRDEAAVEGRTPGTAGIGPVLLTDFPKRPAVKLYDYVTIVAYPSGEYSYEPVPGVTKKIRRFAAKLPVAVRLGLEALDPPAK